MLTVDNHEGQEQVAKMDLVLIKHSLSEIVIFYSSLCVEQCGTQVVDNTWIFPKV